MMVGRGGLFPIAPLNVNNGEDMRDSGGGEERGGRESGLSRDGSGGSDDLDFFLIFFLKKKISSFLFCHGPAQAGNLPWCGTRFLLAAATGAGPGHVRASGLCSPPHRPPPLPTEGGSRPGNGT